ncbi:MAG: VCBS repeat-containing protein [Planctomycetes bacterium]|nr:VCBS repeat-containing protein [Planctomycetota bacterium]
MKKPSPQSLALLVFAALAACARHSGDIAGVTIGSVPRFETRLEIPTGTAVHTDYSIADFTGDGVLDMAVISLTGELRVLVGNGTTFVPGQEQMIGGVPIWMASADFDNDGDRDLVIVRSATNTTDLWINDGNATFAPGASIPVGADALAVCVGDWNDDGNADVAVSRPGAPEIFVGYGDGSGAFVNTQSFALPGGGQAFNLAAGDADHDGLVDLLVADPQLSRVLVMQQVTGKGNSLSGSWLQLDIPGAPAAIAVGDLSGDLAPDFAVACFAANRYTVVTDIYPIYSGTVGNGGTPFGYSSFDVPVPAQPSVATIADVTGDGLGDLCACLAFNATMCVAPQVAAGGVGPQFQLDSSGLPLRPFVGDFDGNGKQDLFALSGGGDRINLWLAKGDGELAGARNFASGLPGAAWAEGGDFDGDGAQEVVTGSFADPRLSILAGGATSLEVQATVDVGLPVFQIEAGDIDGDGKTDLVVSVPGGIKVLRNTSSVGVYSFEVLPGTPATIASGDFPFGIAMADFDRDADMDIAVCDYLGGSLHLIPGTSVPFTFGPETVLALGGGPIDVVAADFTGDGRQDLAVSRASQSDIVVLRNLGAGFEQFLSVPVGQSPNYLVTADFNRDGRADLVVSNATSGTVSVLFGNAEGFTGQDYPAGATPTALLARDLSNDGVPDILVASLQSGDFRIMVGDGKGSFPLLPTFPGTLGASDAVLQDLTGDGRPELVITSLITDRVSVVRNITQ